MLHPFENWRNDSRQEKAVSQPKVIPVANGTDEPAPDRSRVDSELRELIRGLQGSKSRATWLPSLLTAILVSGVFMIYIVVIQPRTISNSDPQVVEPSAIVAESMRVWMGDLGRLFDEASTDAANDRWKNDSQFARELESLLTDSRKKHFEPINRLIHGNLSGEHWSSERASALLDEMANGFKEMSK